MDDVPFGLIELVLVFGGILAFGIWEIVRNRRALARMRAGESGKTGRT